MVSRMGGMDVEEVAETDPDALVQRHIDPAAGLDTDAARQLAVDAGIDDDVTDQVAEMLVKLTDVGGRRGRDAARDQPADRHQRPPVVALDSKATIDGNALFRHPELAELTDKSAEDPQEAMAKEKGLTYVKLGGNIGILGNGAGLCMSTLDVVAQAGGKPANFLDAGGGSKADAIVDALEVITSDPERERDPVQHLRRDHPLRRDRQGDHRGLAADRDRRCRWSSASTAPTRTRGSGSSPRRTSATCTSRRRCSGRRRPWSSSPGRLAMAIIVAEDTKLVVSGLTGREGTFHGLRNRDYGTDLVAGVTPGKGGQDVDGVPVFDSIAEARGERGANTSMIFVPARFAAAGDRGGDRRRGRDGDRDHRGDPGARHAARLLEGEGSRDDG